MSSRAEQKAAARAQREALEQSQAQAVQRQRRLWIVVGTLGLAVILVGIAIVVSSSKSGPSSKLNTAAERAVATLLQGIPQSGGRLGSASAPVSINFFGDLECRFCKEFDVGTLPQVLSSYVRTGKVQITFHALETASSGNPDSNAFQTQQVAALAAGKQNHMWDFLELFYNQQGAEGTGYVTSSYLDGLARQIPALNYSSWQTELGDTTLVNQVQQDQQLAQNYGFNSTPSFVVSGPKGTQSNLPGFTFANIQSAINAVA